MERSTNRRPLASRSARWTKTAAAALASTGFSANAISMSGVIFAAAGAGALLMTTHGWWWWLIAALCIQLRLLANLLDGLIAIEGGRATPSGYLFNEVPDRAEDSILLAAAGYAAGLPDLGWLAAVLAVSTAYIRQMGGSLGFAQSFAGPMAKQHRMAALTLGALLAAILPGQPVMSWALGLIVLGTALTIALRLAGIARLLERV